MENYNYDSFGQCEAGGHVTAMGGFGEEKENFLDFGDSA